MDLGALWVSRAANDVHLCYELTIPRVMEQRCSCPGATTPKEIQLGLGMVCIDFAYEYTRSKSGRGDCMYFFL